MAILHATLALGMCFLRFFRFGEGGGRGRKGVGEGRLAAWSTQLTYPRNYLPR